MEDKSNMKTSFTGWPILPEGMHYRKSCISGSYSYCLFFIFKCSLCVYLVYMSCKHDWCSSSVSFWCHSDYVVAISCKSMQFFSSVSFWCLSVCLVKMFSSSIQCWSLSVCLVDISVRCDCLTSSISWISQWVYLLDTD